MVKGSRLNVRRAAAILRNTALAARGAVASLEARALPRDAEEQLRALWLERAEWVDGFRGLVDGFEGVEQTLQNVWSRLEMLDERVKILERRSACPPPPDQQVEGTKWSVDALLESEGS